MRRLSRIVQMVLMTASITAVADRSIAEPLPDPRGVVAPAGSPAPEPRDDPRFADLAREDRKRREAARREIRKHGADCRSNAARVRL